jgi:predicted DNA-binding protein
MGTTITLPDELGKRIAAVARSLNIDADVLAIGALGRFVEKLEDEARTREAIARYKAGQTRVSPGAAVFARYLEQGVFSEDDFAQARAEVSLETEIDAQPEPAD